MRSRPICTRAFVFVGAESEGGVRVPARSSVASSADPRGNKLSRLVLVCLCVSRCVALLADRAPAPVLLINTNRCLKSMLSAGVEKGTAKYKNSFKKN